MRLTLGIEEDHDRPEGSPSLNGPENVVRLTHSVQCLFTNCAVFGVFDIPWRCDCIHSAPVVGGSWALVIYFCRLTVICGRYNTILYYVILYYIIILGPTTYMWSAVGRNVVMRLITLSVWQLYVLPDCFSLVRKITVLRGVRSTFRWDAYPVFRLEDCGKTFFRNVIKLVPHYKDSTRNIVFFIRNWKMCQHEIVRGLRCWVLIRIGRRNNEP